MSMTTDMELMNLYRHVGTAAAVASNRGYQLPPEYLEASAVASAARTIRDTPPPMNPPMPVKAKDVVKYIDTVVAGRADHELRTQTAAEIADSAERNAGNAIVQAVPEFLRQVCDDFDVVVEDFRRLLTTAPRGVSGAMTGDQFELHAELLRSAEALSNTAHDRASLAMLMDEGHDIGSDILWLVLEPNDQASMQQVRDLLTDYRGRLPSTIDEWEAVARVGLSMARVGDVARRKSEQNTLTFASSNAPDGGRIDKSYGDARGFAARPALPAGLVDFAGTTPEDW